MFDPTDEQQAAIALFGTGASLAIEAGAGCGKTATLKLLAESTPDRRGSYVAFNRSIVDEAKERMPQTVAARTIHSLGFGAVGKMFKHRLNGPRMRSDHIARQLGVDAFVVPYGAQRKVLQPGYLGGLAMRAIRNFCQSADAEPDAHHIPYIDGIDPPDDQGRRTWSNNDQVRDMLAGHLADAWADLNKQDGRLPYSHDVYVKAWERNSPKVPGDFVMLDEAQDASPVMESIILQQTDKQLIVVGDSSQAIYVWRGAVDALDHFKQQGGAVANLSQSFRFGPVIADVANLVLDKIAAPIRLKGHLPIASRIDLLERPDCVLTRSNACAMATVLNFQRRGITVHLVGGGEEIVSFARAAGNLIAGQTVYHPELACFTSWGEVLEYVRNDALGGDLKLFVDLIEEYGVETILRALDRMPSEANADVVVSTAHKAKGREWPRVQLAGDFAEPSEVAREEWKLLYVAATRAQEVLDVIACEPLALMLGLRPPLAPPGATLGAA